MAELTGDVRERVRERYAAAAVAVARTESPGCGCGPVGTADADGAGCIAGALTEDEFRGALAAAGLVDVEIRETHRVHEHAAAAIVRARKPAA